MTWQQVRDLESANVMILSAQSHYQHKSTLYNKPNYQLYDMHDAKMIYYLTAHSQWNQKHSPFLLRECKLGESVNNPVTHKCIMLTHDEQIHHYDKSKRKLLAKQSQVYDN